MAHTELDLRERRAIEDMLNAKIRVREIAVEIGRHVSTVYRDIKRNGYTDEELPELNGYYGVVAQRAATQRRARRRKLVRLVGLRKAVIKQLKEGWSPEQIAGRLQFEGQTVRVSHETIYAYVYGPDGQSKELARYLPSRRKKRGHHTQDPRGHVFPPDRSIHQRPDYVNTRETFGEWEGDLMIFERAQGKMNVASLVERKTRFAVLFRNSCCETGRQSGSCAQPVRRRSSCPVPAQRSSNRLPIRRMSRASSRAPGVGEWTVLAEKPGLWAVWHNAGVSFSDDWEDVGPVVLTGLQDCKHRHRSSHD